MITLFGERLDELAEDVAVALLATGYIGGFVVMVELALQRLLA